MSLVLDTDDPLYLSDWRKGHNSWQCGVGSVFIYCSTLRLFRTIFSLRLKLLESIRLVMRVGQVYFMVSEYLWNSVFVDRNQEAKLL